MRKDLVAWQWSTYPANHRTRANLLVHVVTQPLYLAGFVATLCAPLLGRWGLAGPVAMLLALVAQGRGHRGEPTPPVKFDGALDFITRFNMEQFVTWPRFVRSGGFAKAWRDAATAPSPGAGQ